MILCKTWSNLTFKSLGCSKYSFTPWLKFEHIVGGTLTQYVDDRRKFFDSSKV